MSLATLDEDPFEEFSVGHDFWAYETPETRHEFKHIVQLYRYSRSRQLTSTDALFVDSIEEDRERTEELFEMGRYDGVDAFTLTGDPHMEPDIGPVFHVRLGQVPWAEYEE